MNLNSYIPFIYSNIIFKGQEINVSGVCDVHLEIDKLQGSYLVWVDVVAGEPLVDDCGVIGSGIKMAPVYLDRDIVLEIDSERIPGKIKKIVYSGVKHAYLVNISVVLDKEKISKYIYKELPDEMAGWNRFDILDL